MGGVDSRWWQFLLCSAGRLQPLCFLNPCQHNNSPPAVMHNLTKRRCLMKSGGSCGVLTGCSPSPATPCLGRVHCPFYSSCPAILGLDCIRYDPSNANLCAAPTPGHAAQICVSYGAFWVAQGLFFAPRQPAACPRDLVIHPKAGLKTIYACLVAHRCQPPCQARCRASHTLLWSAAPA